MLKYVVEEYVRSATPVSSETIVRRYDPNVSSATVRNEFAQLEDVGLISHPHTSAGRVPTDPGYRFFVEHLMESEGPTAAEQRTIPISSTRSSRTSIAGRTWRRRCWPTRSARRPS